MSLVTDHYSRHLGRAERNWNQFFAEHEGWVLEYSDSVNPGMLHYATFCVSAHVFQNSRGESVCQELVLSVRNPSNVQGIVDALFNIAEWTIRRHELIRLGRVITLPPEFKEHSDLEGLLCWFPFQLAAEFECYRNSVPPVSMIRLLPLRYQELELIAHRGWRCFIEAMYADSDRLLDLNRSPYLL